MKTSSSLTTIVKPTPTLDTTRGVATQLREVAKATNLTSLNAASTAQPPELPSQIANFLTNFDSLFCKTETSVTGEATQQEGKLHYYISSIVFCDDASGTNPINVKIKNYANKESDGFDPQYGMEEIKVGNSPWVKINSIDGHNEAIIKVTKIV